MEVVHPRGKVACSFFNETEDIFQHASCVVDNADHIKVSASMVILP